MENELLVSINKALSRINGLYQKWYQKNSINSYQLQTLNALYNEPMLSQKEISDNYQIPAQTVNNAIKTLEKQGYVQLIPDERDKRWRKISFTEEGVAYAEKTVASLHQLDLAVMKRMGKKKYKQLIALLGDYGEALQEETKG